MRSSDVQAPGAPLETGRITTERSPKQRSYADAQPRLLSTRRGTARVFPHRRHSAGVVAKGSAPSGEGDVHGEPQRALRRALEGSAPERVRRGDDSFFSKRKARRLRFTLSLPLA